MGVTDTRSAFGGIRRAFGNNAPMAPAPETDEEKMIKLQALQQLMQQQPQMAPEAPATQPPVEQAPLDEAQLREQEYLRKKYKTPMGGVQ